MCEDLVAHYRGLAIVYGNGLLTGDSDMANSAHADMKKTVSALSDINRIQCLYELYADTNASVQLCAATDTFDLDRAKSIEKLKELSITDASILGLVASAVLKNKTTPLE